jgi:hypothetical protein
MGKLDIFLVTMLLLSGGLLVINSEHPFVSPSPGSQVVQTAGRDGSPHATDLGGVELTAHEPRVFDLGSNSTCTLVGRPYSGGMVVNVELRSINVDGKLDCNHAVIAAISGRQAGILVGGTLVEFTPTLKQPLDAVYQ